MNFGGVYSAICLKMYEKILPNKNKGITNAITTYW